MGLAAYQLWQTYNAGEHSRGSIHIQGDTVTVYYALWYDSVYHYTDDWGRSRERSEPHYLDQGSREPDESEVRQALELANKQLKALEENAPKDTGSIENKKSVIETLETYAAKYKRRMK